MREGKRSQFYILTYKIIGLIIAAVLQLKLEVSHSWGVRLYNDIAVNYVRHTCLLYRFE